MRSKINDRIVDRIAEDGQQRRDDIQVDGDSKQRDRADRDDRIVQRRDERPDAEAPPEPERV